MERGELYLEIYSNTGVQNLTISLGDRMKFHSLKHLMENQKRRVLVQN